ncbi:uncharacterized protein A4U43_C08F30090 [Asparagus officinalis]|nr:uncharacterized protein A4U43_C08F30090 [Asparagus officinalis]
MEDSLKSLSLDYLNLLINGQLLDGYFSVEGPLSNAHRWHSPRSLFLPSILLQPRLSSLFNLNPSANPPLSSVFASSTSLASSGRHPRFIPQLRVFLLVIAVSYSAPGSPSFPASTRPRPNCGRGGCGHSCSVSGRSRLFDTLAAARSFGCRELCTLNSAAAGDCQHLSRKSDSPPSPRRSLSIERRRRVGGVPHQNPPRGHVRSSPPHCSHRNIPVATVGRTEFRELRGPRLGPTSSSSNDGECGEGLDLDAALGVHYSVDRTGPAGQGREGAAGVLRRRDVQIVGQTVTGDAFSNVAAEMCARHGGCACLITTPTHRGTRRRRNAA